MFDNVTRLFSLKGDDRVAIGASLSNNDEAETALDAENSKLEEKDIDSVEIGDHALIDDLISADDDLASEFDVEPTETSLKELDKASESSEQKERKEIAAQDTTDDTVEANQNESVVID